MSNTIAFKNKKHIHFTGIKGVGQAALAICAKDLGIKVTGSDVGEHFVTDETLKKAGIDWNIGFGAKNVSEDTDLLITTGAHGGFDNPEVLSAKKLNIPTTSYAEAMSDLSKSKEVITVVGVGGKTTTCSILATLFEKSNLNPSYVVGVGSINPIGLPGRYNESGKHFICEGDEYVVSPGHDKRAKFLLLKPKVVVVTNIEHDHPDIYPKLRDSINTFRKLFKNIPKDGLLVACIDNKNVRLAIEGLRVPIVTYGFSKAADYVVSDLIPGKKRTEYSLTHNGIKNSMVIKIPGSYNALNATASFIVGKHVGIAESKIRKGLSTYLGCRRRFEYIGDYKGALVYDDYAHHPEEIKAVLKAAKGWFPNRRLIALFQPHTYSRTKALFKEFSKAFKKAELVGFMDVYSSAREKVDEDVSSEKLAKETKKHKKSSYYTGDHKSTLNWIKKHVKKEDLFMTIGAGDVFHLHQDLLKPL